MRLLILFVCTENLLDILSPVKATASSSYETQSKMSFGPELAIQADTGYVWANCFVSQKEPNPWFRLQFKSLTEIFNVRLGVRDKIGGELPRDFVLSGMNKLSVYVSESQELPSDETLMCGNSWKYTKSNIIDINCEITLSGHFVHVTVPSSSDTYLIICHILFNSVDGTVHTLVITENSHDIE